MAERNPSPPRLSIEESELIQYDSIGDTVFSKKWVLGTLMKLLQVFQNHEQEEEAEIENEVDDNFDGELCELWDMSMNEDVVRFLQEVNAAEVLRDVILKSQNPRITEVSVGILANMACNQEVCAEIGKSDELINIVTALLDDTDPPILVEVTRLMNACVMNEDLRDKWMAALNSCTAFKHFIYILENSLNVDLLQNTSQLVDNLLDFSDDLLNKWADINLVNAVCEALKQMRAEQLKIADVLLHVLQLLSTTENGVKGLVSCTSVVPLLCHFIAECGHDEGGIIVGRESSLTSCFSVLNVVLVADPLTVLRAMEKDACIIKILLGLLGYSCKLHRKRSRNSTSFSENLKDVRKSIEEADSLQNKSKDQEVRDCKTCSPKETGLNVTSGSNERKSCVSSGDLNSSAGVKKTDDEPHNSYTEKSANSSTQASDEGSSCRESSKESSALSAATEQQNAADDSAGLHYSEDSIHHHYFTGAVMFLKEFVSHAEKLPGSVSRMLAPHEKILQKVVHYSSRIKRYQQMVMDLVESTSSVLELSSLSSKLSQAVQKTS